MNTGQMILTMGAMIFLSAMVLRVNTVSLKNTTTMYNSKFNILAVSIGNTMIEEISKKAFDENTISNTLTSTGQLTNQNNLGPDSETYSQFDDIDDYDGYSITDATMPSAIFNISCSVGYVRDTNPDQITNSKQWTKKITITITSISMKDTVRVSTLYSYWVFR
jgi:MSHA pilin protein MshD